MDKLKAYIFKHFEKFLILFILVSVAFLNYVIPNKISFLNFYFLPIIIAGYFLGTRQTLLAAGFCFLLVMLFTLIDPGLLAIPTSRTHLMVHVVSWGAFLMLTGLAVGKQHDRLKQSQDIARSLEEQMAQTNSELQNAGQKLQKYHDDFETRVRERTEELLKSKETAEILKTKMETALFTTVSPSVAKMIMDGRIRNEKRDISVMFADIVGFTTYSEKRGPELVVQDLNRYLRDIEPILQDFEAHIDKFLGDGIMCEFGAPIDYTHYRLQAVLAALRIQLNMATMDYPWEIRMGIASGGAIIGLIGSKQQSYTAIGDVVNLAARLEKACLPGSILIDAHTYEGVKRFIEVRPMINLSQSEGKEKWFQEELEQLHKQLDDTTQDLKKALLYHQLGRRYMGLTDYRKALECFENALKLRPDNEKLKLAFADASMKLDKLDKIQVKGRSQAVAAYEVVGIRDVLADREKFPPAFEKKYHHIKDLIGIPMEVTLPVEALDGCIGHSTAVAVLSYALASELNVPEPAKEVILKAGFLADVGKKKVSHHLLNRQESSLSTEERDHVNRHFIDGPEILAHMGYNSKDLLRIIRHSHEKFDGTGTPDNLRASRIPLGSRILHVADTYDSLTSWRPFRDRWDRNAALAEIRRETEAGYYDPKVVKALFRLVG